MLDDTLIPGLRLVVCGTAAGKKSAQLKAYYAGPGNKFWKTLHQVGLTPYQLEPTDFRQAQQFGIGFTDLIKDQSGNDSAIDFRSDARDRLRSATLAARPGTLCFNGKRAAQEYFRLKRVVYGLQIEMIGTTKLFVAPSTSAAASGAWDLSVWEDLAGLVLQGEV